MLVNFQIKHLFVSILLAMRLGLSDDMIGLFSSLKA